MNKIRELLVKLFKILKLNSFKPNVDELTVFIKVKIDSLKELSKVMPLRVKINERKNKEIIKIIIDKKYL